MINVNFRVQSQAYAFVHVAHDTPAAPPAAGQWRSSLSAAAPADLCWRFFPGQGQRHTQPEHLARNPPPSRPAAYPLQHLLPLLQRLLVLYVVVLHVRLQPAQHAHLHTTAITMMEGHTSTPSWTHGGLEGLSELLSLLDNGMLILLQLLHPALESSQLEGRGQGSQRSLYQGGAGAYLSLTVSTTLLSYSSTQVAKYSASTLMLGNSCSRKAWRRRRRHCRPRTRPTSCVLTFCASWASARASALAPLQRPCGGESRCEWTGACTPASYHSLTSASL